MKASVQPATPALRASPQTRRNPPALLVAAGGALVVVLALAIYVLWPRHNATSGRGSDVYGDASLAKTTSARSGGGQPSPPIDPAPTPAVAPTATNGESSGGCEESSFRFREIVAPCFGSQDLCNVGVSVRFDGDGQPIDVSFTSEVPPAITEAAREARACVARRFAKLVTPCSKSRSVHYTQRCNSR